MEEFQVTSPIPLRHLRSVQAYTTCLNVPAADILPFLRQARVTVLGCGGLGGHVIELLARAGVGTLRLVDDDHFTQGNLNRQILCTAETIGQLKVEAAAQRVHTIDSSIAVERYATRLDSHNALFLLQNSAVVVDALDNIPSRRIAAHAAATLHIPLVYGAVAGFMGLAAVIFPSSSLLERLYPLTDTHDIPEYQHSVGIAPPTPALIAAVQTSETLKILLHTPRVNLLHDRYFLCDMGAAFAGIVK